jgi:hypothetical protein
MKLGALLKWVFIIKGVIFERVAEEVCSETFLQRIREAESSYKNLMKSPNNAEMLQRDKHSSLLKIDM